jgi:hypothetical protein
MNRLYNSKQVFVILLAGILLSGCFAPIIYGGYKLYQSSTHMGVSINVQKPAPEAYAAVVQSIDKNKVYKILSRDDKEMVLSAQSIEQKEIEGTVTVSVLTPESSRLDIVVDKKKDIDPKVQQKALVDNVMGVCAQLRIECTEQKK